MFYNRKGESINKQSTLVLPRKVCHYMLITHEKTLLGHSNVFICFVSFENPKTYQPARENFKQTRQK
jgi:hypothetical protein